MAETKWGFKAIEEELACLKQQAAGCAFPCLSHLLS